VEAGQHARRESGDVEDEADLRPGVRKGKDEPPGGIDELSGVELHLEAKAAGPEERLETGHGVTELTIEGRSQRVGQEGVEADERGVGDNCRTREVERAEHVSLLLGATVQAGGEALEFGG